MKDIALPARLAMADENPDTREAKLQSVRRRLFCDDPSDKSAQTEDEIERRFAEERARHVEEKSAKWNFDFKSERPMKGQWQWEHIDKSNDKQTSSGASGQDAPGNADAGAPRTDGDAQRHLTRCTRQISNAETALSEALRTCIMAANVAD